VAISKLHNSKIAIKNNGFQRAGGSQAARAYLFVVRAPTPWLKTPKKTGASSLRKRTENHQVQSFLSKFSFSASFPVLTNPHTFNTVGAAELA